MRVKEKYKDIFGREHIRYSMKRKKRQKTLKKGQSFEQPYLYLLGKVTEKTFGIRDIKK